LNSGGLFHEEAQKHQCHHYLRMYGGQVATAAMYGFGATLGADAANAAVGEMRVRTSAVQLGTRKLSADSSLGMVAALKEHSMMRLVAIAQP
jgi:hypothetical protein